MKKLLIALVLVSLPATLAAQQAATGLEGLQFVAPLRIATGVDNNFLVDRTDPNEKLLILSLPPSVQLGAPDIRPAVVDDKVLLLSMPKIAYVNDSRRHEFLATWLPEFELFKNNADQNSMNNTALASFNYYLKRNLQLWVADNYRSSKDPTTALDNVFVILPRSHFRENTAHASLEFQPNRVTSVAFGYDNSWAKFGQTDPFQTRILDTKSSGYSFTLSRLIGRTQRISARYALFKFAPIDRTAVADDAVNVTRDFEKPIHSLSVQYRVARNASMYWGASAGFIKLDNGSNYTFGGTFNKRLGNFWAGASYTRDLTFDATNPNGFVQGLNSYGFYESIVAHFNGQFTRNTAIAFDTTMARGVATWRAQSSKALLGRLRLDYRVSDRKVLFTSWEAFAQSENAYVRAPIARNRFLVGIEISLSDEASRRHSRINEDEDYVALTDHAIRRRRLEED